MEKEFGLLHRSQLGEEIACGGYPDVEMGYTLKSYHTSNFLNYKTGGLVQF